MVTLLPEAVEILIGCNSLQKMYSRLVVSSDEVTGVPVKGLPELREKLGFNPFDLKELEAWGVDIRRPVALGAAEIEIPESEGEPHFTGLALIPVSDGEKAAAALKRLFRREAPQIRFRQENGLTLMKNPEDGSSGGFFIREAYLYCGFRSGGDGMPFVRSMQNRRHSSPDRSKRFKKAITSGVSDADIFCFADIRKIVKRNFRALKKQADQKIGALNENGKDSLTALRDLETAVIWAEMGHNDLTLEGEILVRTPSDLFRFLNKMSFHRNAVLRVKDRPAMLLGTALDMARFSPAAAPMNGAEIKSGEEAGEPAEDAPAPSGFLRNLEPSFYENLDGNLCLGFFDGLSISLMQPNGLMLLGIHDASKMRSALETSYAALSPDQQSRIRKFRAGDGDAYVMNILGMFQIYVGVKGNELIFATGRPLFEAALDGDAAEGFAAGKSDAALKKAVEGRGGIFYLDFREVRKLLDNFPFLIQGAEDNGIGREDMDRFASRLHYLLVNAEINGSRIHTRLTLKTGFARPFFTEMAELNRQMNAAGGPPE